MKQILTVLMFFVLYSMTRSQVPASTTGSLDSLFPVRGLSISAPKSEDFDEFVKFIDTELPPRNINTLILIVDYNYQYKSHPELADSGALSKKEVKKLVAVCKKNNIRIIPQIDLLGHQSAHERLKNLLKVYPEFDETPLVKMPEKWVWPNADNLACKSYCPLHPEVHNVIFDIVDEICDVFKADAFHAGMDEVFYLGEPQCPRCSGRDKAELFADEVRTIHDHLAIKGRKLWIWGDRLLDGKTTGLGMWEASFNNTYRAIDMIPKDVMICDWHYERPDQTAIYFAMKGFDVVTCPWNIPENAVIQAQDMVKFRNYSSRQMKDHFMGMVQTVWGAKQFFDIFYGREPENEVNTRRDPRALRSANCFKALFDEIQKIADTK